MRESERWARALRNINHNVSWWLRPLATVAFLLTSVLSAFALLGVSAFTSNTRKERQASLDALLSVVNGLWSENRTDEAVAAIAVPFDALVASELAPVHVSPYGTFSGPESLVGLAQSLHDYAMLANRYDEAIRSMEGLMEQMGGEPHPSVVARLARALSAAGQVAKAKELLLRNLDPSTTDSELHQILAEL